MNTLLRLAALGLIATGLAACGSGDNKAETSPNPPAQRNCNSNYSGACLDKPGDYDCAGGSGNGPNYVHGPIRVIGIDVYGLDRDGDGIACE